MLLATPPGNFKRRNTSMRIEDEHLNHGLEQTKKCDWVKPVDKDSTLSHAILSYVEEML